MEIKVLDHGFVRLVESWGGGDYNQHNLESGGYHIPDTEAGIIEAARQSTQGSFRGWEKDAKLLKYLYDNKHCYDSETEVLVKDRGFVKWSEVVEEDLLAQYCVKKDSLIYTKPKNLVSFDYEGKMYRVNHSHVDLLVTPNHKMFVKLKDVPKSVNGRSQQFSYNWKLIEAEELGHRSTVRYRKHAAFRVAKKLESIEGFDYLDDVEAGLKLIGFFLGDGHAGSTYKNAITFHLKKKRKILYLQSLCDALDLELEVMPSDNYLIRREGITLQFKRFYDQDGQKILPKYLEYLHQEDSEALLDGLKNSDGSVKRAAWVFNTSSRKLAESFKILCVNAGKATGIEGIKKSKNERHRDLICINVNSRSTEPVVNQGSKQTSYEDYKGKVWCAETETGVLIVRRNGKVVLSGNSTPFEFAGMVIEVKAPIFIFRQWVRHRTQSFNEMSARYGEVPNENYLPSLERLMANSKDGNKQAGSIKGSVDLTERNAHHFLFNLKDQYDTFDAYYQEALNDGVPKELARIGMPVGRYSQMRASVSLRNWLAFLTLRLDPHAQWEIQQYAKAVASLIEQEFPQTYKLFVDGQENPTTD